MNSAELRIGHMSAAKNAAQATAVINKALEAKLIWVADPEHPRAGYVPHWA